MKKLFFIFLTGIIPYWAIAQDLYRDPFAALPPGNTLPASWGAIGKVVIQKTDGQNILSIEGNGYAADLIALPPKSRMVHLSCKYRTLDLIPGKESWQNGRLALAFLNANKQLVGPWPEVPDASGTTKWRTFEKSYTIPPGAFFFRVTPANFGTDGFFQCAFIRVNAIGDPVKSTSRENVYQESFSSFAHNAELPKSWNPTGKIRIVRENGKSALSISGHGYAAHSIPLHPNTKLVKLSCQYRTIDLIPGKENWQNGRLALAFLDAQQKLVGPWPEVPNVSGTTPWKRFDHSYRVPVGAVFFRITPANFGKSGIFECTDISVSQGGVSDAPLPSGVVEDPELKKAWREASATQGRICLNGLWRFFPQHEKTITSSAPASGSGWGWFKVPGIWPQRGDWMLAGAEQEIIMNTPLTVHQAASMTGAWYKREITVPGNWQGRRIAFDFQMLQSYAKVFLDGKNVGELIFPGGKIDISKAATPGRKQVLTIYVTAKPLVAGRTIFTAPDRAFKENGFLRNRGITGDLFLISTPQKTASSIYDVRVRTQHKTKMITLDFAASNLPADAKLKVTLSPASPMQGASKTVAPVSLTVNPKRPGRMLASFPFPEAEFWDLDTPQNQYLTTLTLQNKAGDILDETLPVRFGFRDFQIKGRDFFLNGKKIHLRGMILKNNQAYAGQSNYNACYRTLKRLKESGFNFFITSNYHFDAGSVSYMDSLYRAANDLGVLCSFSLPHLKDFQWKLEDSAVRSSFISLTDRLLELASNHPSIVLYAMNHNATGYEGDQNPLTISGVFTPHKLYNDNYRKKAIEAAGLVNELDPSRPVYNHQSGNLGTMYTLNIYLNWSPVQERSNWLEHWSKHGVKPLFFVEWGPPHISTWSNYRGPGFIWNCRALIQLHDAEFAAAYYGEDAYRIDDKLKKNLIEQQERYAKGTPFQWPVLLRSTGFQFQEKNYLDLQARFTDDNWRSHRAHGISSMLLWDQDGQWYPTPNEMARLNRERFVDITKPGIVPDLIQPAVVLLYGKSVDHYLYAPEGTPARPTPLGKSMLRWNQSFCAFIAGKTGEFTEKRHHFFPGAVVEKSIVLLNDTRREGLVEVAISCPGVKFSKTLTVEVEAGERFDIPVAFRLPAGITQGSYPLEMKCRLKITKASNEANAPCLTQTDRFILNVLPVLPERAQPDIYLFDPKGKTAELLQRMQIKFREVNTDFFIGKTLIPQGTLLILGRESLSDNKFALSQLRTMAADGIHILVMEQTPQTLMERLGFRMNVMGLRELFALDFKHPLMKNLKPENLTQWAGEATMTEPYVDGATTADPRWIWCGFENTRVWRCRNNGNVASVLIEKPEIGNFTPILVGGFDLQFSPLLEYSEKKARILFCQLDLSGRTCDDPAGLTLMRNMIDYVATPVMEPISRNVVYSGNAKGMVLLQNSGYVPLEYKTGMQLDSRTLCVLGPGFSPEIKPELLRQKNVNFLTIGLDAADSRRVLNHKFTTKLQLPDHSQLSNGTGLLRGIGQSDLFWRGQVPFAAQEASKEAVILDAGTNNRGALVMLQVPVWYFAENNIQYFRKTHRRSLYLTSQLLRNLGGQASVPLLDILSRQGVSTSAMLDKNWVGKSDPDEIGEKEGWYKMQKRGGDWKSVQVPGLFDQQFQNIKKIGLFWYSNTFSLPENFAHQELYLSLGVIDDESWIWLNGKFLGSVTEKSHPKVYWHTTRSYSINSSLLHHGGENQLVVLVRNLRGSGGILGVPRLDSPSLFLKSFYRQVPKSTDDPYRYYRW